MEELKREIEVLSRYKMNVFHWHLTENQAWRLESKIFPMLNDSCNMSRMPGKYYTIEEAKELVRFCKEHNVLLIPEVDMPGHSAAFIRAFRHDMQSKEGMAILKLLMDEVCEVFEEVPYLHIGTDEVKFTTWRKLWIALAEAEKELGLNITQEQIDEMKTHQDDVNFEVAETREKEVRHDVMSHVYAFGVQCPKAKPIIHLGATSCFVGDNADLIVMDRALKVIEIKLVNVINKLKKFALEYKDLPTLGFYAFPTRPAYHRRQARDALDAGSCPRLRRIKACAGVFPPPRGKGDDGDPGELYDAV